MDLDLTHAKPRQIYNLLIGLVAPRPIAWITSVNLAGQLNAAPFSAYNYMGIDPPIVAVGVGNRPGPGLVGKDTAHNIRETGEFVINVVNEAVAEAMNITAIDFPPEVNELDITNLVTEPSMIVKVPRIAAAPASLECREITTIEIGRTRIILGQVVAIHVKDEFIDLAGPYIRAEELHAVGRMNGLGAYVKTRNAFFSIPRMAYEDWKKQHGEKPQRPESFNGEEHQRRRLAKVAALENDPSKDKPAVAEPPLSPPPHEQTESEAVEMWENEGDPN